MKQVKLLLPLKLTSHFSKWAFENGIKVLLSWTVSDGFFGENVAVETAVPDDKLEAFKTEFKNYIKD